MKYRKTIETTAEMGAWYDAKYREMGGAWHTPPEDCNRHLDVILDGRKPGGLLLDIGCGGGHFIEQALLRELFCVGLEISAEGRRLTRERIKRMGTYGHLVSDYSIESDLSQYYRPFDYVVSIGSLEHVINLDAALANIRVLLKPDGRWYFYCPNELWIHEDQPNERTCTDEEWEALFSTHGLVTDWRERRGDNTCFMGHRT